MPLFVALAALMIITALAFVALPLLRASRVAAGDDAQRMRALDAALAAGIIDRNEYAAKRAALATAADHGAVARRPARTTFAALLCVALLLPATTLLLYRLVGTPVALDPAVAGNANASPEAEHATGPQMQQAIATLAARLKEKPDDVVGWALLARAYQATDRAADALAAFKRAHELAPDNTDLTVEYAQALAMTAADHRIDGEARTLLDGALKQDPSNQRALWLLGIADYQEKKYDAAIARWNTLLPMLAADSSVAASVKQQIADAAARRDGKTPPVPAAAPDRTAEAPTQSVDGGTSASAAGTSAAALTVHVAIDPALAKALDENATLFVFARAEKGPPMPLAVQKLRAGQLPITVKLDDSMSMMPSMSLSKFPRVVVGARISTSGNPLPQSGDLETQSRPIDSHQQAPIELIIDRRVP